VGSHKLAGDQGGNDNTFVLTVVYNLKPDVGMKQSKTKLLKLILKPTEQIQLSAKRLTSSERNHSVGYFGKQF
jgi:hypothetical protein